MQEHPSPRKVALVTGAARRIGAEIARVLHAAGMNVILHYATSVAEATALCQELNAIRPDSAVLLPAPLGAPEAEKALIADAAAIWQRLDVLVNNASRFYRTLVGHTTPDAWDDLMHINLKVPFFLAQAAAPHLAKQRGSIINITDIHAKRPMREYAVYCISKSALVMLTKALAKELAPEIRVNAVAPGAILWPEGENALSDVNKQKIIDHTLLHHAGCPHDIAKAVLYLAQDANYMTGEMLVIDGGRLLGS